MRKVYISGPIKDTPNYINNFARGKTQLHAAGLTPISPCDLPHEHGKSYEEFMREDLKALLECDGIYMLRGWEKSNGARVEFQVAVACGISIGYQEVLESA